MRVGYFFNHAVFIGGGEYSFMELIHSVQQQQITPIPFVPGPGPIAEELKQMNLHAIPYAQPSLRGSGLLRLPEYIHKLRKQMVENKLDLIHTNGARCTLYAGLAARKTGIPVIWHVRVLERDRLLDRIRGWLASSIITNSKAVEVSLKPYLPKNISVQVIYNSTPEREGGTALNLTTAFDLPVQVPVVLFVGRITREKSLENLIAAHQLLHQKKVEQALLIVGPSPDKEYMRELESMTDNTDPKNIIWAGPRNDVAEIMQQATLLVLPSRQEGFGRVIVEAWQQGLPVIATRQGGPAELIRDETNGLLVPVDAPAQLAAAVKRILNDPILRTQLIAGGKESVDAFKPDKIAKQIVRFYASTLKE